MGIFRSWIIFSIQFEKTVWELESLDERMGIFHCWNKKKERKIWELTLQLEIESEYLNHWIYSWKIFQIISWQNWYRGRVPGCGHKEPGSNPVGGGRRRRSFEMEEEMEKEMESLELERKVESLEKDDVA